MAIADYMPLAITIAWALFALDVGRRLVREWKVWGEVYAFFMFLVVELAILIAIHPA